MPASIPPHMSDAEQSLYRSTVTKCRHAIEFGTGGSTLLALATPIESLVSVESDASWIQKLRNETAVVDAETSGRLSIFWADIGPVRTWGHPADARYRHKWPTYSTAYWRTPGKFDLALIDGRFRVACAIQAAINGCHTIAFHDFWNRHCYHDVLAVFDAIESADTLAILAPKATFHTSLAQALYEKFKFDPA